MKNIFAFARFPYFSVNKTVVFLGSLALLVGVSGCSDIPLSTDPTYSNKTHEEMYKNGSLATDNGGISLFGNGDKKTNDSNGLSVNAFLWRASLDTISFMPIASADPFGGLITTDWYSSPDAPNERAKLNVFILDRDLRADGVKVTVFRQVRDAGNAWEDAPVTPATASKLEDTILTRARQLKLSQRDVQ